MWNTVGSNIYFGALFWNLKLKEKGKGIEDEEEHFEEQENPISAVWDLRAMLELLQPSWTWEGKHTRKKYGPGLLGVSGPSEFIEQPQFVLCDKIKSWKWE